MCPSSGCPHPVTQLLLPSPPHISDLSLPPSYLANISPHLHFPWLLWHLFPNELPATQTARSQSGLLLPFSFSLSPLLSFLLGRHITNGGVRDILDLLSCSSLFAQPLCLTTSSPSLRSPCWAGAGVPYACFPLLIPYTRCFLQLTC